MAELVEYADFSNYNLTWVQENVADAYTLDYLKATRATQEEIDSAVPCECDFVMSMEFLATHVSDILRAFVHDFCNTVPHRKFKFYLKHFGK